MSVKTYDTSTSSWKDTAGSGGLELLGSWSYTYNDGVTGITLSQFNSLASGYSFLLFVNASGSNFGISGMMTSALESNHWSVFGAGSSAVTGFKADNTNNKIAVNTNIEGTLYVYGVK